LKGIPVVVNLGHLEYKNIPGKYLPTPYKIGHTSLLLLLNDSQVVTKKGCLAQ